MSLTTLPEFVVVAHTAVAFLLGWGIGYERFFRGRASGTQVYCLVSMASCALTSAAGFGAQWFERALPSNDVSAASIIGSLLTGIGFLGAGIIVKSGASIRGLTTAASIWSSSAIGILVGIHFIGAAIALAMMFVACMVAVPALERRLPGRAAIIVTVRYREGARPQEQHVLEFLRARGLSVQTDSLSVAFDGTRYSLDFLVSASGSERDHSLTHVATDLPTVQSVESFTVTRTSRA
jgi:putative Mg2+ transporter-C (MgtC) family protein